MRQQLLLLSVIVSAAHASLDYFDDYLSCNSTADCAKSLLESPVCVGGLCVEWEALERRDCLYHRDCLDYDVTGSLLCAFHLRFSACVPRNRYNFIECLNEGHCLTHYGNSILVNCNEILGLCLRKTCHADVDCDSGPTFESSCIIPDKSVPIGICHYKPYEDQTTVKAMTPVGASTLSSLSWSPSTDSTTVSTPSKRKLVGRVPLVQISLRWPHVFDDLDLHVIRISSNSNNSNSVNCHLSYDEDRNCSTMWLDRDNVGQGQDWAETVTIMERGRDNEKFLVYVSEYLMQDSAQRFDQSGAVLALEGRDGETAEYPIADASPGNKTSAYWLLGCLDGPGKIANMHLINRVEDAKPIPEQVCSVRQLKND